MINFFERDLKKAHKNINKAKQLSNISKNGEWRFSKCFLYLWEGDYINFENEKKLLISNIKNITYGDNFIDYMKEFTLREIKDNTFIQGYFWIGFLYYKIINNLPYALQYFDKFILNNLELENPLLKEAKKYKICIETELELKEKNYKNNYS